MNSHQKTFLVRNRLSLMMIALALGAFTLLGGCNLTNTVRPNRATDGAISGVAQSAPNWWLESKANVVDARESVVNGDTKKVQVSIFSSQMQQQRFSYKFEWFDKDGMKIGGMDSWESVMILPQQTIVVAATAPSPKVSDWILQISDTNYPWYSSAP
ncbi:MAG: YcfL family protein [Planctomycetota bacterium]|nr:YcfL family protein [Planctomycetota bacterium]